MFIFIIWLEARLQPNIWNTLSLISTVFTCSAITLLEVNRFAWDLGHSIFCRWPWQILDAICAEA